MNGRRSSFPITYKMLHSAHNLTQMLHYLSLLWKLKIVCCHVKSCQDVCVLVHLDAGKVTWSPEPDCFFLSRHLEALVILFFWWVVLFRLMRITTIAWSGKHYGGIKFNELLWRTYAGHLRLRRMLHCHVVHCKVPCTRWFHEQSAHPLQTCGEGCCGTEAPCKFYLISSLKSTASVPVTLARTTGPRSEIRVSEHDSRGW
jgi:hypothetical protein